MHESLEAATAPAEIEGGGKRDSSSADSGYEVCTAVKWTLLNQPYTFTYAVRMEL